LCTQEQQIGLDFALYYEAYATFHELRGNCSAADAVYQDGINRCGGEAARQSRMAWKRCSCEVPVQRGGCSG